MQDKPVVYEANGEQVKLSPTIVRQYLVHGNEEVSDQEVVMFMQLAQYQKLNPFLNEAYLIKFRGAPAQIITSKEAFMKRANANPHYKGSKAGIIVARGDEMKKLQGAVKLPDDKLIGAWAQVERDDREPTYIEVSMDEFSKNQSTWKSMPATMIRKTALVNALREAFPQDLGALYTEDDKRADPRDIKAARNANESSPSLEELTTTKTPEKEAKQEVSEDAEESKPESDTATAEEAATQANQAQQEELLHESR